MECAPREIYEARAVNTIREQAAPMHVPLPQGACSTVVAALANGQPSPFELVQKKAKPSQVTGQVRTAVRRQRSAMGLVTKGSPASVGPRRALAGGLRYGLTTTALALAAQLFVSFDSTPTLVSSAQANRK